ncbi:MULTISPECIES: 50S ribosomal protein L11 methyltransferase [Thalassospira]|jgi:ribosomal protein L11 methyltransferase|uniref:50S ribosomal protein L11 methyltransferase n=2 Tax=Thalassospira TaxID=168934 RepID=A0A367WA03_9PROT|nr:MULTISPECIES: 50S ribosomal protein L11 methyltransferase [Thalassospira]MDG4719840.1 50S ribosomal protein L11 methyltransferase [Thalassospira sp. FZY0004]RCK38286.1 50S ribosomal protein L11 methyltransferase [Thalassospira profundimaris]
MTEPVLCYNFQFEVDGAYAEAFAEALYDYCDALSHFERPGDPTAPWRIEGFAGAYFDKGAVETAVSIMASAVGIESPVVTFGTYEPKDWVGENLRSFKPISVGRFFVHGSHWEEDLPVAKLGLQVDAGLAFGSGEHQTTKGCLAAIDWVAKRGPRYNALDMGCGSGILGMACAKTWRSTVMMADIDAASVRVAQENAKINQIADLVTAIHSNGFQDKRVREAGYYDIICANILARPLRAMAHELTSTLSEGGVVILSGLLSHQEQFVLSAYREVGLSLIKRFKVENWTTLLVG